MQTGEHWVGSWAAAPAPAEGVVGFNNHTIRMNPRISIGGERLRVRISNAYGNRPLTVGAARIALRDQGPAIVSGSERKRMAVIADRLRTASVLTVSEEAGFAKLGGMIELFTDGDRVRFDLNIAALEGAHLHASARLREIASKHTSGSRR